jgi:hypothetical protein
MGPGRSILVSKDFHHGEGREPRRTGSDRNFDASHGGPITHRAKRLVAFLRGPSWLSAFSVVNLTCLIAGHARPKTEGVANTTPTHQSIDNHGPECVRFKTARFASMGGSLSFD